MSTDHITITIQDAHTGIRARCEAWEGSVHLTFLEYSGLIPQDRETAAPSLTAASARSIAAVLEHLAEVADGTER